AEVLLDHIAVVRGEIFADLLHCFLTLLGREISPATLMADVTLCDLTRPRSRYWYTVLRRTRRPQRSLRCRGSSGRRSGIFFLLNQFVERLDDAIFHLAGLRARASQVKSALDIVHTSGNMIK